MLVPHIRGSARLVCFIISKTTKLSFRRCSSLIERRNFSTLAALAWALYRAGEFAEALDTINGALLSEYLAIIYAWVGETDRALKQLAITVKTPGDLSFGQLKLRPVWDPLRNDSRFDEIVASLAPK